jgi:hypothetical protein
MLEKSNFPHHWKWKNSLGEIVQLL